ncbi:hypothetical protein BDW68DRAFT_181233 [Aspergillus falconensis]
MKPTVALLSLSALPLSTAWTFTWRDSSGKVSTEKGTGPSDCIAVNHAKGQLFVLDGEGEENINMLLFTNDECEGEPAGKATVSFTKEASVDLKGFQVVEYGSSGSGSGNATTTKTTTTGSEEDGTVTLPTVSATSTSTSADDEDGDEDEDDGTVTLPTVPATTTNGTSTAEPTTTTATETGSDSETSSTEPSSTQSAGGEEEPTPTGASSTLVPFSLAGLIAVGLGVVAGGF